GQYHEVPLGAERFDAERHDADTVAPLAKRERTPYRAYRMPGSGRTSVAAFVRDPRSSLQVWSRRQGYPGDGAYLDFHKIRWPGGLKLWRVTSADADLGDKLGYDPAAAGARAREHAAHFAGVLASVAASEPGGRVVSAPFDTELFGHWWFEGVDFLGELFRRLAGGAVRPVTATAHLAAHRSRHIVELAEGSWGANGDFSMWMNPGTAWTWTRMWALEDAYWAAAPRTLAGEPQRTILAQATRSLLLAQASDWQFIISTGAAADYAEMRFEQHSREVERLVSALRPDAGEAALAEATWLASELRWRDDVFPDVLVQVAEVLG
ncbi:MAG: 1,4-alpha-glucan branching protein domain-containing protein, partial [Gemmatimonadales bacterium]